MDDRFLANRTRSLLGCTDDTELLRMHAAYYIPGTLVGKKGEQQGVTTDAAIENGYYHVGYAADGRK
jgi:hypothetical protein